MTLKTAVELAKTLETAEIENGFISTTEITAEETYAIRDEKYIRKRCCRCNSEYHLANKCSFKGEYCGKCKVKGHLAKACRGKARIPWRKERYKNNTENV